MITNRNRQTPVVGAQLLEQLGRDLNFRGADCHSARVGNSQVIEIKQKPGSPYKVGAMYLEMNSRSIGRPYSVDMVLQGDFGTHRIKCHAGAGNTLARMGHQFACNVVENNQLAHKHLKEVGDNLTKGSIDFCGKDNVSSRLESFRLSSHKAVLQTAAATFALSREGGPLMYCHLSLEKRNLSTPEATPSYSLKATIRTPENIEFYLRPKILTKREAEELVHKLDKLHESGRPDLSKASF